MKLNFNFKLKNLEGKPLEGDSAGKTLANMLSMQNKGNSIKLYDWAIKLYNDKPIEIDDTDADVLYSLIEQSEFLTVLGKYPMLEYIKKVKESK